MLLMVIDAFPPPPTVCDVEYVTYLNISFLNVHAYFVILAKIKSHIYVVIEDVICPK